MSMKTCSIDSCTRPSRKRGWCETHYSRRRANGSVDRSPRRRNAANCIYSSDCTEKPIAKDLCNRHYYRKRNEELRRLKPEPTPKPPKTCSVGGCMKKAVCRSWCGAHYQRWRRFGDPTFYPPGDEHPMHYRRVQ